MFSKVRATWEPYVQVEHKCGSSAASARVTRSFSPSITRIVSIQKLWNSSAWIERRSMITIDSNCNNASLPFLIISSISPQARSAGTSIKPIPRNALAARCEKLAPVPHCLFHSCSIFRPSARKSWASWRVTLVRERGVRRVSSSLCRFSMLRLDDWEGEVGWVDEDVSRWLVRG